MALNIAMVKDQLAMANRHIATGNRVIIRQRQLIDELGVDGHDTREALALLVQFEDSQALHLADRERLTDELNSADA